MGDQREKKPEPKNPQPANASADRERHKQTAPSRPPDRMTALLPDLDVGEQVFGSSHVFELAAPWNLGPGPAQLSVEMAQSDTFEIVSFPSVLQESGAAMSKSDVDEQLNNSIRIRYSPVAEGEFPRRDFSTEVAIRVAWQDGRIETRHVHVRGRARGLEDRPETRHEEPSPTAASAHIAALSPTRPIKDTDRTSLTKAFETAKNHAEALARAQHDAIERVEAEAGSYVPPPVKHSVWWDLAEGAIMMGTGAIAGMISKALAETLVSGLIGTQSKPVVDSLASSMKDGMKAGAKAALASVSGASYDVSSNQQIAFFDMQRDALNSLVTQNQQLIIERNAELTPVLGSEPDVAIRAMDAIAVVLGNHPRPAGDTQRAHTAAGWLGVRARTSLGVEEVAAGDHETVTTLAKARPAHPGPDLASITGLLDLDIDLEHGPPHVAAATANGVAAPLLDELLGEQLTKHRLPMRLVVGRDEPEPTVITRDEAGRLRISGNFERLSPFAEDGPIRTEVQAELAARRLVDLILAQTLSPKTGAVKTDDQARGT